MENLPGAMMIEMIEREREKKKSRKSVLSVRLDDNNNFHVPLYLKIDFVYNHLFAPI